MKIACIQTSATPSIVENMKAIEPLIRAAVKDGAVFVATPENTCHMCADSKSKLQSAFFESDHPMIPFFQNLARELNITISVGSLSIKVADDRMVNRSYFINSSGEIQAHYDKIHLFDVTLPNGDQYRESDLFDAGDTPVLVDHPFGKIGLSICYDVRFPYLFREYALHGAALLLIPAAFTVPTGMAHWHTLMRARAIENGCYVVAAAQVGTHDGGRTTYGHSVIIDPWGDVLADAGGDGSGYIIADIDCARVHEVRAQIPSLRHTKNLKGL